MSARKLLKLSTKTAPVLDHLISSIQQGRFVKLNLFKYLDDFKEIYYFYLFFFRSSCTIELPESFLVTGGYEIPVFIGITRKVSRYSTSGWIENLPNLNEGRDSHGCGFFYNDAMERVGFE